MIGVDLSAPLLKYAHRTASDLGLEIAFSQQNAERTKFEGESFDLVFAYILFDQLPACAATPLSRKPTAC